MTDSETPAPGAALASVRPKHVQVIVGEENKVAIRGHHWQTIETLDREPPHFPTVCIQSHVFIFRRTSGLLHPAQCTVVSQGKVP
jgi:hypothetical protein